MTPSRISALRRVARQIDVYLSHHEARFNTAREVARSGIVWQCPATRLNTEGPAKAETVHLFSTATPEKLLEDGFAALEYDEGGMKTIDLVKHERGTNLDFQI